jgi:hypothetical protein
LIKQNLDRRPPTLLGQLNLVQSEPAFHRGLSASSGLTLLPNHLNRSQPILVQTSPLASYEIDLASLFDSKPSGLRAFGTSCIDGPNSVRTQDIVRFVRTSDGRGVGIVKSSGGEHFLIDERGISVTRGGEWDMADIVVVLNHG